MFIKNQDFVNTATPSENWRTPFSSTKKKAPQQRKKKQQQNKKKPKTLKTK